MLDYHYQFAEIQEEVNSMSSDQKKNLKYLADYFNRGKLLDKFTWGDEYDALYHAELLGLKRFRGEEKIPYVKREFGINTEVPLFSLATYLWWWQWEYFEPSLKGIYIRTNEILENNLDNYSVWLLQYSANQKIIRK